MSDERLFGVRDAERLFRSIDEVVDDLSPGLPVTLVVDEFDTYPPLSHMPSADYVAEWAAEWASDNDVDEGWADQAIEAAKKPEVVAAFDTALRMLAGQITYRMAFRRIATYAVTVSGDGGVQVGARAVPCFVEGCDADAAWRNANGSACDRHSLNLSQINGGNDAIVGIKDGTR